MQTHEKIPMIKLSRSAKRRLTRARRRHDKTRLRLERNKKTILAILDAEHDRHMDNVVDEVSGSVHYA